ncbi:MAG: Rrf2 family transcriptional regulator [Dehalococcoidales bacterium]|nr:Rrf2 family transcriptional regulator [Dehalococcoidales bacterium]
MLLVLVVDKTFLLRYIDEYCDNKIQNRPASAVKLSTKGRYAVRAMLDLAAQSGDGPTLIKDISARQQISCLYLEQLFTRLKTAGLVRSVRGPRGGFVLARPPREIRFIDIVRVMEGSMAPVECVDNAMLCSRADYCVTRRVWAEVKKAVDGVLSGITLEDLVERQGRNGG